MASTSQQFTIQRGRPAGQARSISGAGRQGGSTGGLRVVVEGGAGGFGSPAGGSGAFGGFGGPSLCGFGRPAAPQRNWGPKAYGPGLNNPLACPPNPFFMERALSIVNRVPNTLVRVETNGEISITDQFGREAEILDVFGRDLTEGLEF
ncbi:unnamed protein product [Meganyctiphanes norvegica]|uniref:Uncharacterized protein n=1 Tax=Meganyctiphanes norvegica TaxID=48144 RepID=A0AAV2RMK7_MEGNR